MICKNTLKIAVIILLVSIMIGLFSFVVRGGGCTVKYDNGKKDYIINCGGNSYTYPKNMWENSGIGNYLGNFDKKDDYYYQTGGNFYYQFENNNIKIYKETNSKYVRSYIVKAGFRGCQDCFTIVGYLDGKESYVEIRNVNGDRIGAKKDKSGIWMGGLIDYSVYQKVKNQLTIKDNNLEWKTRDGKEISVTIGPNGDWISADNNKFRAEKTDAGTIVLENGQLTVYDNNGNPVYTGKDFSYDNRKGGYTNNGKTTTISKDGDNWVVEEKNSQGKTTKETTYKADGTIEEVNYDNEGKPEDKIIRYKNGFYSETNYGGGCSQGQESNCVFSMYNKYGNMVGVFEGTKYYAIDIATGTYYSCPTTECYYNPNTGKVYKINGGGEIGGHGGKNYNSGLPEDIKYRIKNERLWQGYRWGQAIAVIHTGYALAEWFNIFPWIWGEGRLLGSQNLEKFFFNTGSYGGWGMIGLSTSEEATVSQTCSHWYDTGTAPGVAAGISGYPSAHIEGRKWEINIINETTGKTTKEYIYKITFAVDPRDIPARNNGKVRFEVKVRNKTDFKDIPLNASDPRSMWVTLSQSDPEYKAYGRYAIIRKSKTNYTRVCLVFKDDGTYSLHYRFRSYLNNKELCNGFNQQPKKDIPLSTWHNWLLTSFTFGLAGYHNSPSAEEGAYGNNPEVDNGDIGDNEGGNSISDI